MGGYHFSFFSKSTTVADSSSSQLKCYPCICCWSVYAHATTAMTPCCFVGSSVRASADSRFAQASSRFLALFLGGPGLLAAGSLGFAACNAAEGLGVVVAVVGVW